MARRECPQCEKRKAKRDCPVKGVICSVCCGRHRGPEFGCPPSCSYVSDAIDFQLQKVLQELTPRYPHLIGTVATVITQYPRLLSLLYQLIGDRARQDPYLTDEHAQKAAELLIDDFMGHADHDGADDIPVRVENMMDAISDAFSMYRMKVNDVPDGVAAAAMVQTISSIQSHQRALNGDRAFLGMIAQELERAQEQQQSEQASNLITLPGQGSQQGPQQQPGGAGRGQGRKKRGPARGGSSEDDEPNIIVP